MKNISACIVTGILQPPAIYSSCGMESSFSLAAPFSSKKLDLCPQECLEVDEYIQNHEASFQDETIHKQRILMKIALSERIHAVTFIPEDQKCMHILFVQKMAFSCHFCSDEKDDKSHPLTFSYMNMANFTDSLTGMDSQLYEEMQAVLKIFLSDKTTASLEIAYCDHHCHLVSRRWSKKEAGEESFSMIKQNIQKNFLKTI